MLVCKKRDLISKFSPEYQRNLNRKALHVHESCDQTQKLRHSQTAQFIDVDKL